MADELDLDVEKKSGKGKMIMLIVGAILLVAIAVGATLFLVGGNGSEEEAEEAETEQPKIEAKKAYYLEFPHFVVNFEDTSIVNYMQIEMQVMAREQNVLDIVSEHMPVIRNNILLLLSTQKYEEISTFAGKEKLRGEILASIQSVVDEETAAKGKSKDKDAEKDGDKKKGKPVIEAVYFTSFIMQ